MSNIESVPVDLWRNPDQVNRIAAGTIPIGDYEIQSSTELHSVEGWQDGAEPYFGWTDDVPAAADPVKRPVKRKAGRPRKTSR